MHDDLNSGARREIAPRAPAKSQPQDVGVRRDREVEVPIANGARISKEVQAWLDGDAPEPMLSEATAKQVELWKQIGTATAARRQVTTPAHIQQAIMAALPNVATVARTEPLPWWRRTMSLSPVVVTATAAALVAAGAAIGAAMFAR